ncbi:MAG: glycosyl hydrolase [Spirosoma sp.]|nr:glycosyl hydrolase [Spirosoma sp.]
MTRKKFPIIIIGLCWLLFVLLAVQKHQPEPSVWQTDTTDVDRLRTGFVNPPDSARPGVYWYFMDGNLSQEGMMKDLESMKQAGIGKVVFLEVNVGVPRGPVDFLSDQWLVLFKHAVREAERLGIDIVLGVGPGWTGSGGPWVEPSQSMQHLVASSTEVTGPASHTLNLPVAKPKKPYFGEGGFTPSLKKQWEAFYQDVAVLAFPTPATRHPLPDSDEKALYYRAPYSSVKGTKPYLFPASPDWAGMNLAATSRKNVVDLTDKLRPDGTLAWQVPAGNWTVMRFVSRNNGAVTRPAPMPGLGFESDKFDTTALNAHLDRYVGKILRYVGPRKPGSSGGLTRLHMDSWEMGAQNWTAHFRQEFIRRRHYDPLPYYPVFTGVEIESRAISERFLWDVRQTAQELVVDNHANHLKRYAHRHGMALSIEPYDMNPTADLELGSVADVPMAEFWSKNYGYATAFSCYEAISIAHVNGQAQVPAEAFTAERAEAWKQYPGAMKNQTDWALAAGINQFFFHTFQHQSLNDSLKPGMTMGPYGVHWDRNQTWWPMVGAYHRYLSRCQFMLQQGRPVADILYLTPEGAPHVFRAPASALTGDAFIPDRRGYTFDGCAPGQLYRATVKNGQIVFPGGATYRLLVLPAWPTMSLTLLKKIQSLVKAGATVVGCPPRQTPGLTDYARADQQLRATVVEVWGGSKEPVSPVRRPYGQGFIHWGGAVCRPDTQSLYPTYAQTAAVLKKAGVIEDFVASVPMRYLHRQANAYDLYFVSNPSGNPVKANCQFRTTRGKPQLWDPLTGHTKPLPQFTVSNGYTTVPLQFDAYQSYLLVFAAETERPLIATLNVPRITATTPLTGSWTVAFDPRWGGPPAVVFDKLTDWTLNTNPGIQYYSGIATYRQTFDYPASRRLKNHRVSLDLGRVNQLAKVSLNGREVGVVWTAPWRVDITDLLREKDNKLTIEVANLWVNRLIGDEQLPDDGVKKNQWPDWLLTGQNRPTKRFTFTTNRLYKNGSPLIPAGLMGPVTLVEIDL